MQASTKNAILLLAQSTTSTAGIHPALGDIFFDGETATASDGVAITTMPCADFPFAGALNGRELAGWLNTLTDAQIEALTASSTGSAVKLQSGGARLLLPKGELDVCPAEVPDDSVGPLSMKFETTRGAQARLASALKTIVTTGVDNTFGWAAGITFLAERAGLRLMATNNVTLASTFVPAEVPEMLVGTTALVNAAAVKILHRAAVYAPAPELSLDSDGLKFVGLAGAYDVRSACVMGKADPLEFLARIRTYPVDQSVEIPADLAATLSRHQLANSDATRLECGADGNLIVRTATERGEIADRLEGVAAPECSFTAGASMMYRACSHATRMTLTDDAAAFFAGDDVTLVAARG